MYYSSVNSFQNQVKVCTLKVQDDVQLAIAKFCLPIKDCLSQVSFNDFTIKSLEPKLLQILQILIDFIQDCVFFGRFPNL